MAEIPPSTISSAEISLPSINFSSATSAPKSLTRKRSNVSSEEENDNDDDDKSISDRDNSITEVAFNYTQMNLFKKGKKLRDILSSSYNDNSELMRHSRTSELSNALGELKNGDLIEIVDEKSAKARIQQWQSQESQCEKILMAAESFQLLNLVSLVKIYEDLLRIGERLSADPKNNITNVKMWVIKFVRNTLNINNKAEQRNRLGCERLQSLFNRGITSVQLVQAGCRKCDFFVKQEYYDIFLSQLPESDFLNSSNERFSPLTPPTNNEDDKIKIVDTGSQKAKRVRFTLGLGDDLKDIADKYSGDEYISRV